MNSDCPSETGLRALWSPSVPSRARHATFLLRNARIVLPHSVRTGSLYVRDGLVHRIGETLPSPAHVIDCEGDIVLPGLIETHTDNLERHLAPRPGTSVSADRAILAHDAELAAAGITTALDAVTLGGDVVPSAARDSFVNEILASVSAQAEGLLRIDHHLHLRCELSSPDLRGHLERAFDLRMPRVVSLMDHTPGQGQWTDIERFRRHYAARYGLGLAHLDALVSRRQHARSQFAAANRRAALELALRHRCVLASHDDVTHAHVEQAHRDRCTIVEFPTSLEAARAARSHGMYVVAGAPNLVRGSSHSGNVAVAELAREGLCDVLSSDYCPSSLLQGAFLLARAFEVPIPEAVASVSATPARALGLLDRGCIEAGKRADLVRVRETRRGPVIVSVWCAGRQVA